MNKIKFLQSTFSILLLLTFLSSCIYSQNSKVNKSKVNSPKEGRQLENTATRAVLAAVYPDPNNSSRFAYPLRDLTIAADITKAIYTDPILKKYDISFKVKDNRVYLYGKVDLDGIREYAAQAASKVTGVQGVQNNINYYQDEQNAYEKDLAILEDIYSRYESSPVVKIENIHVAVYNGAVTLSGTVSSYMERDLAVSEAYKTGATHVYNYLLVGEGPETRELKNPGDFVTFPY